MKKGKRLSLGVFSLAAAGTAVLVGTLPGAQAAEQPSHLAAAAAQPGPTSDPGFPTFVHLPADQAAHPGAANEWWDTVGHLWAGGHEYGYEVSLVSGGIAQIALTDVTAGQYASQQTVYAPSQFSASTTDLNVRVPDASLSGPLSGMHLTADLPHGMGTLDLTLDATGPALYDNGTGLIPFLGGTSYYYSLPHLRTTGTLTLGGTARPVTGISWLDRQWGNWNWADLQKWTWMGIQLSNGQDLNLWDMFDSTGEHPWATVLGPDGSERVVSVSPLAPGATDYQTSPATGQRYAGKWIVRIPSLHAVLTVTASPVLQEIQSGPPAGGTNDADASVRGTYLGRDVSGRAYVQQSGIWK
jgi:predicted secreted hydrolase